MSSLTNNDHFITAIRDAHLAGFGFTPLIGAGISAPSGVPLVQELAGYLRFCIAVGLGLDKSSAVRDYFFGTPEALRFRKWNPRTDAWPDFSEVAERPTEWQTLLFRLISNAEQVHGKLPRPAEIYREAYGAMAEWRSSLQFLSRLSHASDEANDSPFRPVLLSPQSSVVDSFFRDVVSDKSPTLAHEMIALLSQSMRIKTILTTNFDDLLEKAYTKIGDPLAVYNVQLNSTIPSYHLTAGRRAIVKLHGGKLGLRADFSLDDVPTDNDARNFLSFLLAKQPTDSDWESTGVNAIQSPVNHLLVMGFSGSDRRIRVLIKESCKRLDLDKFRIFWIAFSETDEENAINLAKEIDLERSNSAERSPEEPRDPNRPIPEWFVIIRHYSPGLLLLEVYQHVSLGLPPRGVVFPATSKLRVPCEYENDRSAGRNAENSIARDSLIRQLEFAHGNTSEDFNGEDHHRLVILSESTSAGQAVNVASSAFRSLTEWGNRCVWLEMDEIESANDLFEHLIEAVSNQVGAYEWTPILQGSSETLRRQEISRLLEHRRLTIFLNARDGAGTSARPETLPEGWLSSTNQLAAESEGSDQTNAMSSFCSLLEELVLGDVTRLAVVLIATEGTVVNEVRSRIPAKFIAVPPSSDQESVMSDWWSIAEEWLLSAEDPSVHDSQKLRFLAALCFANRTRYASSLWTWAHHGSDIDAGMSDKAGCHADRVKQTEDWLQELESLQIIRRKPGGFIWMHVPIREEIRLRLLESELLAPRLCGEIHHGLAECGTRLFLSSRDPLAAFEVSFHRLQAAGWYLDSASVQTERRENCATHVLANITGALTILNVARTAILKKGFSRGARRRLKYLERQTSHLLDHVNDSKLLKANREKLIDSLHRFKCRVLAILRDSSREIAELSEALCYHKELNLALMRFPDGMMKRRNLIGDSRSPKQRFDRLGNVGTLFIATRSYGSAQFYFNQLFSRFQFPSPETTADQSVRKPSIEEDARRNREYLSSIEAWLDGIEANRFYQRAKKRLREPQRDLFLTEIQLGIVNLLRRQMQLFVVRGNLYHLISRRGLSVHEHDFEECETGGVPFHVRGRQQFSAAVRAYRGARLVLLSALRGSEDRESLRRTFDDIQFLETYFGLVHSFLRDFQHAHRRLNNAESCLLESKVGSESLEMAIIELHRAEIFTQQAVFKPGSLEEEMTALGNFRSGVFEAVEKNWDELIEKCLLNTKPRELSSSLSYIDDGLQALVRAELLLNQERKNVWWTTWFFELKLKLIELKMFACVSDPEIEIPVVSMAHTPRGMRSELDRLLLDSMRLSRLDIFRQARILDSYSSSLVCVFTRWHMEKKQRPELKERIELMRDLCLIARKELEMRMQAKREVHLSQNADLDADEGLRRGRKESEGQLDPHVRRYVEHSIDSASKRIGLVAEIDHVT